MLASVARKMGRCVLAGVTEKRGGVLVGVTEKRACVGRCCRKEGVCWQVLLECVVCVGRCCRKECAVCWQVLQNRGVSCVLAGVAGESVLAGVAGKSVMCVGRRCRKESEWCVLAGVVGKRVSGVCWQVLQN